LDVFQTWITVGYPDLIENPKLLKHLSEVMRMLHTLASENSLRKGISALEEILVSTRTLPFPPGLFSSLSYSFSFLQKRGNQPFLTGPSPTSLKPKVMRSDRSFLDFHPLEIARQLSMIEYDMLKAVPLTEYRNKRFATPEKSPNLAIVVDRFNKVCSWVAEEILSTANIKKRIVVLGRFIEVADVSIFLLRSHPSPPAFLPFLTSF
jgi:hypothetical protein